MTPDDSNWTDNNNKDSVNQDFTLIDELINLFSLNVFQRSFMFSRIIPYKPLAVML